MNGKSQGIAAGTGAIQANPGALFVIGARVVTGGCSERFPGLISDVAVYDHALDASTISGHFLAHPAY